MNHPVEPPTHVFLTIELPSIYTDDMLEGGDLDEFRSEWDSESDFILNAMGEPGIVKLRTETQGEKEGSVIEVWGSVHSASLGRATPGYGPGPHITEDQLEAAASVALNPDEARLLTRFFRKGSDDFSTAEKRALDRLAANLAKTADVGGHS